MKSCCKIIEKRIFNINYKADYLKQKLKWVEQRIGALDEIKERLRKMGELAQYAPVTTTLVPPKYRRLTIGYW